MALVSAAKKIFSTRECFYLLLFSFSQGGGGGGGGPTFVRHSRPTLTTTPQTSLLWALASSSLMNYLPLTPLQPPPTQCLNTCTPCLNINIRYPQLSAVMGSYLDHIERHRKVTAPYRDKRYQHLLGQVMKIEGARARRMARRAHVEFSYMARPDADVRAANLALLEREVQSFGTMSDAAFNELREYVIPPPPLPPPPPPPPPPLFNERVSGRYYLSAHGANCLFAFVVASLLIQ
jgi:hypothetical protein